MQAREGEHYSTQLRVLLGYDRSTVVMLYRYTLLGYCQGNRGIRQPPWQYPNTFCIRFIEPKTFRFLQLSTSSLNWAQKQGQVSCKLALSE